MKNAQNKHTAIYETAIAYHGCLEPMNGVAYEKDGIMHIHSGHQSFTFAVGNTAAALGVARDISDAAMRVQDARVNDIGASCRKNGSLSKSVLDVDKEHSYST